MANEEQIQACLAGQSLAGSKQEITEFLAELCVDSAASLQGQSPSIFWGASHQTVLDGSVRFIEEIGLEEAVWRFNNGVLDFPASAQVPPTLANPRER